MNLFAQFETRLHNILEELETAGVLPLGAGFENVTVEPPRDASFPPSASARTLL